MTNVPYDRSFIGYALRLWGVILEGGRTTDAVVDGLASLSYRKDLQRLRVVDADGVGHTVAVTDGDDFDYAEAGDLVAVGAAAAAGSSSEIPRADHVHALSMDASMVGTVPDNNLTGGVEIVHKLVIADGATADVDFVLLEKFEVQSVTVVKTGGAGAGGNSVQLKTSGGTAITDAIATTGADKAVTRAGTVDDAVSTIAAGGTLRITRTRAGGDASAIVYVRGVRRA